MNDEIASKPSDISLADEDAPSGASRPTASWITSKRLTNAETGDACSRNVQSFTTFWASDSSARRDLSASDDGKMLNHRRESLQQRHARQSSVSRRDQNEEIESASQRYENAVLRYQKPRLRSKRQISRDHQQQGNDNSSSDESVARNKSKSTSSIDAQSVNNILDEFEDLDYCRSSDLSDIGNINVTNFEAIIMDQQKRQQQQERSKLSKVQIKSILPTREKIQPVLKVNQQTQVRQRSRDRQKDSSKAHQQENFTPTTTDAIESGRSKMPEILLRKGEVQKRVDEWLNQAHSQNFPASPREKPLTRSNSSAEQKSQRRYRVQDSRSRSIDEEKNRLNGGTSSSYDDLTRMDRKMERGRPDRVNVGVNTNRGAYKEYLAVKNKVKQQDYGFGAQSSSVALSRSGDSSPASRIPQRELFGSSFRSKRAELNSEEKNLADGKFANLAKTRGESNHGKAIVNSSKMAEVSTVTSTTTTSIISNRKPSLKRSGNGADQNSAVARSLVKEETDPRLPRGAGISKSPLSTGNLDNQGELISPNKDGESRRPTATTSGLTPRFVAAVAAADKAVEVTCKSTEASTSCATDYLRGNSPRIASMESGVAIESRRRLQRSSDVRREARSIDQSRQEQPMYGLTVGAHVRALQGRTESRNESTSRIRCHQVGGTSQMEMRKPSVLSRKDLGVSPSRDRTQDRAKASSFKPNNQAYIATSDSQKQSNEQNVKGSKIAICEAVSSGKITRYTSPDHVERIYERSLQPQVIHADDLESILRPTLPVSPYGERIGASRSDRDSSIKETSTTLEDESFDRIGESRHEHLETIVEDDRKSEDSIYKYPEIGLKQCLKVQQSLPNGRSRDSTDKRKDNSSIYTKDQQHPVVFNEPARTFATFQISCQSNIKSNVQSRSMEMKPSKEEIRQNSDETTMTLQDFVIGYQNASREDQDRLTIHSRENSNLSTATIPIDELESQRSSRSKNEGDSSRNRLQFGENSQDRVEETEKNAEERGAVINEVLVKNLRFEQDLPQVPTETKVNHSIQQVNFHNILCDDYENEKLKNRKLYMTKEEMDHQRLIEMLKKRDFEALKTVSNKNTLHIYIILD